MHPDDTRALFEVVLEPAGREVLAVRPSQVEPGPGGGRILGFEVDSADVGGPARGARTELMFLQSGERARDGGGLVVEDPDTGDRLTVWRYPDDPALPALAAAVHDDSVEVLLSRLGVPTEGVELAVVSYRPGKRAVIRVLAPGATTYVKVVRPHTVELVHARHQVLREAGLPVPQPLGWSPTGLLVLEGLPGVPAVELLPALTRDTRFPSALGGLLTRLAGVDAAWPARRTPAVAVDWYAEQLVATRPDLAARVAAVGQVVPAGATAPDRVGCIHGDLHLGQVLVDPAEPHAVLGLLDVDTAGPGHPGDDVCGLLAHAVVTDLTAQGAGDRSWGSSVEVVRRDWPALLSPNHGPPDLGPRLGAHLLAYALGPATRGEAPLVESLLAEAEAAAGLR